MSQHGIYRASTQSDGFFAIISDPLNSRPCSLPDDDITPHIVKSVTFNQNYTPVPANAAGMIVFPTNSPKLALRLYGFDPATQTMNFIQLITPDEILSENFIRGRPISSGLKVFSNTLASGNFALSGSLNSIAYLSLPPLNSITPGTLTTYKMDNVNVISGVSSAEGVVMVSPLYGEKQYRLFDTENSPTTECSLQIDKNDLAQAVSTVASSFLAGAWAPVAGPTPTITNPAPAPLPWGRTSGYTYGTVEIGDATATGSFTVSVQVWTWSGDATTYARVSAVTQSFTRNYSVEGAGLYNWEIPFDFYSDPEIAQVNVIFDPAGLTTVSAAFDTGTTFHIEFTDYYQYTTKEPGVIALFQNLTANQQLSLSGMSHWEVIPNQDLVQNVKTSYSLDDPAHFVAATTAFFSKMGDPYRYVYPRLMFEEMVVNGAFRLRAESIVAHAAIYRASLRDLLKSMAGAVAPIALGALGGMVGGPAGAALGANLGTALARPLVGKASTYHASVGSDGELVCSDSKDDRKGKVPRGFYRAATRSGAPRSLIRRRTAPPAIRPPPIILEEDAVDDYMLDDDEEMEDIPPPPSPSPSHRKRARENPAVDIENDNDDYVYTGRVGPFNQRRELPAIDFSSLLRRGEQGQHTAKFVDDLKTSKAAQPLDSYARLRLYKDRDYCWALCALGYTDWASEEERGVLAHLVVSKRPLSVKSEDGRETSSYYLAIEEGVYIERHIMTRSNALGILGPLKAIWKVNEVFLTIVPVNRPLMGIEGESYELALFAVSQGLPSDIVYSGSLQPGLQATMIHEKVAAAQLHNMVIMFSYPDTVELDEVNESLASVGAKIFTTYPTFDVTTTPGVVGFSNDPLSLMPISLLLGTTGHIRLSKTASEVQSSDAVKSAAGSLKRDREIESGVVDIDGRQYTRDSVAANYKKWLADISNSTYFDLPQNRRTAQGGVSMADAWKRVFSAGPAGDNWRRIAKYYDIFTLWNKRRTGAPAKKRKPSGTSKSDFVKRLASYRGSN